MNDVENNLKKLKRDYDSLKYPGDLASDIPLDIQRPAIAGRIGAFLAMAAALLIGLTCWMMWPGDQNGSNNEIVKNNPNIVNPSNPNETVKPEVIVQLTDQTATDQTDESIPSVTSVESTRIAAVESPSWGDISPVSSYATSWDSTTIPYQSITVPTVDEIDQHLTDEKKQSATKQG